jgi:hypothetical protein
MVTKDNWIESGHMIGYGIWIVVKKKVKWIFGLLDNWL